MATLSKPFTALRRWHTPLLAHSTLMGVLVVVSLIGLIVDPRTLGGESVWVKPLKSGLSFAGYGLTLAWLLSTLVRGRRAGWWFGTAFAVSGVLAGTGAAAVVVARRALRRTAARPQR